MTGTALVEFCDRVLNVMATDDAAAFDAMFHPDATNREAVDEPADCRGAGPGAFMATGRWLTTAFSDLSWDVHDVVEAGELVVAHVTMSGRQTGPFVAYGADALPETVFPPTGRRFAVFQTHWFRVVDGKVIEHWANRDDLGMGKQLGWTPPGPRYLARMLLATRRARSVAA
ncbi:ester cyclase [Pseudonocardia sp.]|jgi:predicted ester cyclase|uniref:ester cyclase n=1 Tax=Pseudonocardia sp. TaxID=60912 RepID=UPI003D0CE437